MGEQSRPTGEQATIDESGASEIDKIFNRKEGSLYAALITMVAMGFGLLTLESYLEDPDPVADKLISALSVILLVNGTVGIMYQRFFARYQQAKLRDAMNAISGNVTGALDAHREKGEFAFYEHVKNLSQLIELRKSVHESRLTSYLQTGRGSDYCDIIRKSKRLDVVLRRGATWTSSYRSQLAERLGQAGSLTRIYLVDPTRNDAMRLISKRSDEDPLTYRKKLRDLVTTYKGLHRKANHAGKLEIYALKALPGFSMLRGDEVLVVTPYQTSVESKLDPPQFIFSSKEPFTGFPDFVERDLKQVREESVLMYSCNNELT